jgi:hypothetical protein
LRLSPFGKIARRTVSGALLAGYFTTLTVSAWAEDATAAQLSDKEIRDFIDAHTASTRIGKVARWEDQVCPSVAGLPPGFTKFLTQRVREVATMVGAPVDTSQTCKANVEIVFTNKPQALVDDIRAKNPMVLGYYDNDSQADRLAAVTRPIQAWYVSETKDLHGKWIIDTRYANSKSSSLSVTGSHLGDGLRSALYQVSIVADLSKLADYEMGALADYIAVLALSQPASPDACQALSSIVDLTTPECPAAKKPKAVTGNDIAFLRGLYQGVPGGTLAEQRDGIAVQMKSALEGH